MADRSEFDRGFEQGLRAGRLEGHLFEGLPQIGTLPGARFAFQSSFFDSYADYERQVVANLRAIHGLRWRLEGGETAAGGVPPLALGPAELRELEAAAKRELWKARDAVDAEREEGRGRACVVAAMRASPQTPASVLEYRHLAEFVAEDRRRGVLDWPEREDGGGADFGHYWQLENPFRRWEMTSWRISWLGAEIVGRSGTDEIYALEFLGKGQERSTGRVWLLGTLATWKAVDRALQDLQRHAIRERNSLIVAANAVDAVGREEGAAT